MRKSAFLATALCLVGAAGANAADPIRISVGHQSMCTDTYTAGIVIKEMKFLEKYLPKSGKYAGVKYEIEWKDYTSGGPITNQMLANKIDIGVMGDYPLIVNGAKFQETKSLRSLYVAGTGYNVHGSGNAIVVPVESNIYSLADLKSKDVSVPVGSAAWGMTYKAMQDAKITDFNLKNQAPAVGAANIAAKKIDAHADFCPWSEIMEFRGTGRKIYDGSETGIPYLHGVVVREDFASSHPDLVVAFLKAVIDAGAWINSDPKAATEMMEKWTGVEKEVLYLYFSKGGVLTLEPTIKPKWVEALKFDHTVLAKEAQIPPLDFDAWITDKFIRAAYKDKGMNYDADLKKIYDPKTELSSFQMELWHAREGVIGYPTIEAMLKAKAGYDATGQKVNATYVYDQVTGIKLFGHVAFYVKDDAGKLRSFMRKGDAEKMAGMAKTKVMSYAEAIAATS